MAAKVKATATTKVVRQAPEPGPALVKVTAVHPYQIGFEGRVVGPGGHLEVPPELAEQWVASGIAQAGTAAKAEPRRAGFTAPGR